MKLKTFLFILLSFLYSQLFSQAVGQNPKEEKYRSEAGRFEVNFPSEPNIHTENTHSEIGEIEVQLFIVEPKGDDNENYTISYIDYPEGYTDSLSIKEIFDLLDNSQSSLINSADVQTIGMYNHYLLGYPGREYRWHFTKENYFLRIRLFMVGDRLYVLGVKTAPANNFNKSINQFFNSFELINIPPNREKLPLIGKELSNTFFDIDFPGQTETREIINTTMYGQTKTVFEFYEPKDDKEKNLAFFSALLQFPSDITQSEDFRLETYYKNTTDNSLKATQSSLIYSKEIMQDGVKGVETKQNFKGGQIIITTRLFLIRDVQISVQVMSLPDQDGNQKMMQFLNSLKLNVN